MVMRTTGIALLLATLVLGGRCVAQQEQELLDLRGIWKFEIGDDPKWASPKFDDSRWAQVLVPAMWEDEGFPGYDGYAWYRIRFQVPAQWRGKMLFLKLGYVDDVDEVYLNGKFVAFTGLFPPTFNTAYGTPRSYFLAPSGLTYGAENTLAVRVYDQQMGGGIVKGRVGIYEVQDALQPDQPLPGPWKFKWGDDPRWKDDPRWSDAGFDDSGWQTVDVPAYWETQGFKGRDGFGWYRTRFTVDRSLEDKHPILLLGMIDDLDETFLDGQKIGKTGSFPDNGKPRGGGDEYKTLRAYTLPSDMVKRGGVHTLAVRVFDVQLHGGIYAPPVGLVSREKFLKWQRNQESDWNWFNRLFEAIRK
jgi:hypothetical protein